MGGNADDSKGKVFSSFALKHVLLCFEYIYCLFQAEGPFFKRFLGRFTGACALLVFFLSVCIVMSGYLRNFLKRSVLLRDEFLKLRDAQIDRADLSADLYGYISLEVI